VGEGGGGAVMPQAVCLPCSAVLQMLVSGVPGPGYLLGKGV